ncbi:hypothetical protein EKD04_013440 [Chloroflexales bacterium ZM16-3]|nr:hypothetical protein [Chloroflexales bacterium ZM16-3]
MRVVASGKQITSSHLRRWDAWPTAIIAAAILTIAILNPLLCVLHCALSNYHTQGSSGDQSHFLCNLASETQPAATPFDLVWDGPRAVYEVTLPFAVPLALITVFVTATAAARICLPQHIPGPSLPPPKI